MAKTRIGVMRGGIGGGYGISLKTGKTVLTHLAGDTYEPIDILITKDGTAHIHGIPVNAVDLGREVDLIFNALHGEYGEDGQIQWLLNRSGITYTGSNVVSSALAAHKANAYVEARRLGLNVPAHYVVTRKKERAVGEQAREIFRTLPQPSIIKPLLGGSSVGVSVAHTYPELVQALLAAFAVSDVVIAEEYIVGREATCGIIDGFRGQKHYALPPVEICLPEGKNFLDHDMKTTGADVHVCPGRFSEQQQTKIIEAARLMHERLGLRHYSRSDFIVSPRGLYFLEINTMPGLDETMPFVQALSAVGISLPEFLDHVISRALHPYAGE